MRFRLNLCFIAMLFIFLPDDITPDESLGLMFGEACLDSLLDGLNECTTGVASGAATADGRPLLWKNRDLGGGMNQEFHYLDYGSIPYISITYAGETDQYYGGVNAVGFAVENSNSYNLPAGPWRNGWGGGDDDGFIMAQALASCRTVDDFQDFLDSLNTGGRTLNCNYGAFDAYGGAAMFETAGYFYTRCDAIDAPGGFLVRSNYSYNGNTPDRPQGGWGPHRHNAAYRLFRAAVDAGGLTTQYILQRVCRDLSIEQLDPYPLPFDGYYGNYSYGCLPNGEAVCRSSTRGVMVAQGVREGERPENAILWAIAGSQLTSVAVPVWVRAGCVPSQLDGPATSRICDIANLRLPYIYNGVWGGSIVNTWRLTNPQGAGLWDFTLRLERWIFAKTAQFINSPQFSYDRLRAFQNEIAQQAADSLAGWKTAVDVSEVAVSVLVDNRIVLRWRQNSPGNAAPPDEPRGYRVYRSSEPFRENYPGQLIAEIETCEFIDRQPMPEGGYYRVEIY
ncbi:MAG: hypothetical protein FJY65_04150 [Calditrichaeota bacterium]|nr:hypothetical protein [Calditrichota bacterium]